MTKVTSRKDDNHHAEVDEAMVSAWRSNVESLSTVCAERLKSAIEIANGN
jgi:hypothetical protein